jgi:hypothetical protein
VAKPILPPMAPPQPSWKQEFKPHEPAAATPPEPAPETPEKKEE